MPSENVYVVTCNHSDEHGESTELLRIFKSRARANEYALAYLNELYEEDWEEYEESTGSDGFASVHAEGFEDEVFDINVLMPTFFTQVKVYGVVFDESQQRNRYGALAVDPCSIAGREVHTLPVGCQGDRFLFKSSYEDVSVLLELDFSNPTSTMAAEQVYVVMCDSRGDSGEGTDILAIYKSLESANHFALRYLKDEYGEDFEYEEYEEDTSDETVTVTATGWENDTLEIYVVVRDLLP